MNKTEKKRIIKSYAKGLTEVLIDRLPRVPKEWDGIELRNWFHLVAEEQLSYRMYRARAKDFNNARIINNI